tara:strand:- start:77 stop:718 length:642 start_codon:yes stop_codon:yes gene_type:complete
MLAYKNSGDLITLLIIITTVVVNVIISVFNLNFTHQKKIFFEQYGNKIFGARATPNRKNVLELFKKISQKTDRLVNHCLSTSYPDKERAERLHQRWNKVRVRETDLSETTIAYIVNKDYELRICVTDKINGQVEDLNTAMFVMIHELGHMASVSFGHGKEFWSNFRLLLKEAIRIGVYDYQDYSKDKEEYCGIMIYSTPCSNAECENQSGFFG